MVYDYRINLLRSNKLINLSITQIILSYAQINFIQKIEKIYPNLFSIRNE